VRPSAFAVFRVDHQLEFGRLEDRQIGGSGAREYPANIDAGSAVHVAQDGSIADEAAGHDEVAPLIHRRNAVARRQAHQLFAPAEKEGFIADEKRVRLGRGERCKRGLEFVLGSSLEDGTGSRPAGRIDSSALPKVR
jgi:hypothetical protein